MRPAPTSASNTGQLDPVVVLAADENFAMPLAATVRSALDNLGAGRKLQLYLLDGGIHDSTKDDLERSWPASRFQVHWISVDAEALGDVPTSGHINLVSYFRILMPRLLPDSLSKVIFLDADLIIRADLTDLWNTSLDGAPCLAVQDCHLPFVDAEQALANYDKCGRHLASAVAVSNYRELGLNPLAPYFNAGVLVVDVDAWRKADLTRKMLDCLVQNRDHVEWHDQYALNVVLSEQWRPLDPRWNQGANIYQFKKWFRSPYDRETFTQLRDDPYIIHFTTTYKPWKISCLHPLRHEFFRYVDRTEWAGWRPARFSNPRAVLELLKTQDRRLRMARRHLQLEISEWFDSWGLQGAKRAS